MVELGPTLPDIIETQLPFFAHEPQNARFIALLKYYYTWLTEKGQPTEFITNILNYKDIDLTTDEFREHIAASLYDILPTTAVSDKVLVIKHIAEFLKSKGTLESFDFIMTAIYGETFHQIEWNSDKLFRASANEHSRRASIVIESDTPWSLVEGSELIQTAPNLASAIIETHTYTVHNGKVLNLLTLQDKSIIGEFAPGGETKVLHNSVDRTKYYEEHYYTPISFLNNKLTVSIVNEPPKIYNGLIVKQLGGSTFRAIVDTVDSKVIDTGKTKLVLNISNYTGTFLTDKDVYIFPAPIENIIYTKDEFEYGTVSSSIVNINISNGGSLYTPGDKIKFLTGDGIDVEAVISEIGTGGVTEINIIEKGYGYSVGDVLTTVDSDSSGSGLLAVVDAIDGIDADVSITSELNSFRITNGGWGYKVGDKLTVSGGTRVPGVPPTIFQVSSVNSAWLFKGIKILTSGRNYPSYSKISLIDTSTLSEIPGFSAVPNFDSSGGIIDITTNAPTISTASLAIIVNGYGAEYSASLSGGSIVSFTRIKGGVNYIDPVVEIIGDGVGAIATAQVSNGTITSLTLVAGGTGYTSATVLIKERYGSGFSAIPKIQNPITGVGTITGLTILSRGVYTSIPPCFDNVLLSTSNSGEGATVSLDFRLATATVKNPGKYYTQISTNVVGHGSGAILEPILKDGVINGFNVISGGTGYTYAHILIGEGHDFVGAPIFSNGSIVGITILKSGWGYSSTSPVTIIGDGTGANITLSAPNTIKNGVLKEINVHSGGSGYYYGTTITAPTSQPGAIPAILTPTIIDGVIKSVNVIEGEGYIQSDLTNITINNGTPATLTSTVSDIGKIVSYEIINGGTGYFSQNEVKPLTLSTDIGTGSILLPVLNNAGEFVRVDVYDGGKGYTNQSVITVTGGGGTGAILRPVIYQGRITDVIIENTGSGYKYGTSAIVVGGDMTASIIPIVETGITNVEIIAGGSNYIPDVTSIEITDPTGSGAELKPIIKDGAIVDIEIINKGVGYTNPTLTATVGSGAVITAQAKRFISYVNITTPGTGYTYADVLILGDGKDAELNLIFDKLGSIDSLTITNPGAGYTITPRVVITDTSNRGGVSKIKIKNTGDGYITPPIVFLPNKYNIFGELIASGAKFTTYGDKIGAVRGVSFLNNGAAYKDVPIPIFPLIATLTENAPFKIGELITVSSNEYRDINSTYYATLESGDKILLENGDYLTLDVPKSSFNTGITAKVLDYDYERNTIKLDLNSDNLFLADEQYGKILITEDGYDIVHELSASLDVGDVIIGKKSNARATIKYVNRAFGTCVRGGVGFGAFEFLTESGKLNNKLSVLADNNRFQDYAYVIKSHRALKEYEKILKNTVHPAGFAMFADVITEASADTNILNEIGYNELISIFYIYSSSVIYQESIAGKEWSDLDDLYGDFTKFKYKHLPISPIKDFTLHGTSKVIYKPIDEYIAAPITDININYWSSVNTILQSNIGVGPDGKLSMHMLSDYATTQSSNLSKTITIASINKTYSIEFFVKKETNPLTYPKFVFGDAAVGGSNITVILHTKTGEYKSTGTGDVKVLSIGEFWFVKLHHTITTTGTGVKAKIIPAAAFISDFKAAPFIDNITSTGSIYISSPIIKDITGVTPILGYIRVVNSAYAPRNNMVYITATESEVIIR